MSYILLTVSENPDPQVYVENWNIFLAVVIIKISIRVSDTVILFILWCPKWALVNPNVLYPFILKIFSVSHESEIII